MDPITFDGDEITVWDDVDLALGELRRLHGEVAIQTALFDRKIAGLQEEKSERLRGPQERIAELEGMISVFAKASRGDLGKGKGKGKSLKLVHGRVGWRKGTPSVVFVRGERYTVDALRSRGHGAMVEVRESVAKPRLKALTDEELAAVGVEIKVVERLFIELAVDPVVDAPPGTTGETL